MARKQIDWVALEAAVQTAEDDYNNACLHDADDVTLAMHEGRIADATEAIEDARRGDMTDEAVDEDAWKTERADMEAKGFQWSQNLGWVTIPPREDNAEDFQF